jgi:hypothetical protein
VTTSQAPATLTEKQFTGMVRDLAGTLGWAFYHPWLSVHSPRGWPDVALCRPPRLVLAELKRDARTAAAAARQLTDAQQRWLDLLRGCPPVEVYVWRPADWDRIVEVLR